MSTIKLFHFIKIFFLIITVISCSNTRFINVKSENYDTRIKYIILHFTSEDFNESIRLLTTRSARPVSSHYLISNKNLNQNDIKTNIYQLVDEKYRAWHAGVSYWNGERGLNDISIGIEIVNQSRCSQSISVLKSYSKLLEKCIFEDYPKEQIDKVIYLINDIVSRNPRIKSKNIIGHSDIAPDRKIDPGPLFPWKKLYENGIGAWYEDNDFNYYFDQFSNNMPTTKIVQSELLDYGYDIELTGVADKQTSEVVRAFQLHFRPQKFDGVIDRETAAIIFALNNKY
tara:strand:- start:1104 stop:1958 length:855 start_codon:yes stop_codon:yes gene_type:complete